jgi:hypothetical protein
MGTRKKHIKRRKYLIVIQDVGLKDPAVGNFFVITATWIDPQLIVRQFINTSKCGRFYALQFIFMFLNEEVYHVASKCDMTGEFNEREKNRNLNLNLCGGKRLRP